jgi:hypothetical protein
MLNRRKWQQPNVALAVVMIGTAIAGIGCTTTVRVVPTGPSPPVYYDAERVPVARQPPHQTTVGLYVDPTVKTYVHRTRFKGSVFTNFDSDTIDVDFEIGPTINVAVENSVRAQLPKVKVLQSPECSEGTNSFLVVEFATEPYLEIRWLNRLFTRGGGATAELVLNIRAKECDGREIWRRVVVGYGSADEMAVNWWSTSPTEAQFRPAVDAAVADLVRNLPAALSTADWNRYPPAKEDNL